MEAKVVQKAKLGSAGGKLNGGIDRTRHRFGQELRRRSTDGVGNGGLVQLECVKMLSNFNLNRLKYIQNPSKVNKKLI